MRVQLLVTKTDFNLPNIENEFKDLGIQYEVEYIEEHPELVSALNIRHSPNIIVDGKLAFQRQPSESELKAYFGALEKH
ncbi:MAG: thioredoxin family protein [Amphritea sp.]